MTAFCRAAGLALGAEAQNLGALKVDKNLNGKLKASTAMSSFDLFMSTKNGLDSTGGLRSS